MSHVDNDSWQKHQSNAVKAFLKTAVVIDNQPWVKSSNRNVHLPISTDTGFGDENTFVLENPDVEISEHNEHDLNIRAISDVFAEKGIACAFVLPDDDAGEERDSKVNKVLQAAKISDLIVIDWYLERQSSSLTLEILEKIAKADDSDNGRLRLLCVYTGEPLGEEIFDEIKQYLKRGGVTVNDVSDIDYCAENASTIVILRNKTDTQAATLPDELIRLFTRFSNGLIPAFALASVGAIRDNTHHMLTRFGNWLDSSYIANKLITNPSSDVSEMLRDLFVTECDNALGLEKISDKYLSNDIIKHWVEANSDCIGDCQVNANYSINRDTILMLLDAGNITDKGFDLPNNSFFKLAENKRNLISESLAGGVDNSKKSEYEFGRLVAFKREAFGRSKLTGSADWTPTLTSGTLLRYCLPEKNKEPMDVEVAEAGATIIDGERNSILTVDKSKEIKYEYLICFTPACDTLRLKDKTPFVFLKAFEDAKKYSLVVNDDSRCEIHLRLEQKKPVIRTFDFMPDPETQKIRAIQDDGDIFSFTDSNGIKFTWLGELRYSRTSSEMAALVSNWMRIGISDSEFIRLAGAGKF